MITDRLLARLEEKVEGLKSQIDDCQEAILAAEQKKAALQVAVDELTSVLEEMHESVTGGPKRGRRRARPSVMAIELIKSSDDGLEASEIADALEREGIKRSTVHSALYNLRKRGNIHWNESTGVYSIPNGRSDSDCDFEHQGATVLDDQ